MKIYTKTGDKGETGLFGGERVPKNSLRINVYGTIDELNSFIGLAITELNSGEIKELLQTVQNQLFSVGADLATPDTEKNKKLKIQRTPAEYYLVLEEGIDKFEQKLEPLKQFILPGGSKGAALLHVCRTVCRRAERQLAALMKEEVIGENNLVYLNRLSDLLFVLSRYENNVSNIPDIKWTSS